MITWVHHFVDLGRSRVTHPDVLDKLQSDLAFMQASSPENEDFVLNTPIVVEELEGAIKKLKRGKSSGPDGIIPEHILFGGQNLRLWLINIFNAIINLESVPPCLTDAIIVPIYKGKGKNPNLTSNYRGIALTSVVGKLFERILLQRLVPLLEEKGIPHYTQSAYQAGISCADPTEVVQEAIRSHI